jgi:hypothetical protein
MVSAIVSVLTLIPGSEVLNVGPRYGNLPPGEAPLTEAHDPLQPCALCGTTSKRIARAPYGIGGDQVWVLCKTQAGCMTRLRALKGEAMEEAA